MGAKSTFSQEVADRICERIGEGEPLRVICREDGMPAWRTVYLWMETFPDFAAHIASARARGYDAIASECLDIADDARNDFMTRAAKEEGGEAGKVLDAEHVQRSKLRVETRLKLLAKWDPKRYGERIDVKVEDVTDRASILRKKREDRLVGRSAR